MNKRLLLEDMLPQIGELIRLEDFKKISLLVP